MAVIAEWHTPVGKHGLRHALVRVLSVDAYLRLYRIQGGTEGHERRDSWWSLQRKEDRCVLALLSLGPAQEGPKRAWEIVEVLYEIYGGVEGPFMLQRMIWLSSDSFDFAWEGPPSPDPDTLPESPFVYCLAPTAGEILGVGGFLQICHTYEREDPSSPTGTEKVVYPWIEFVPPDVEPIDVEAYRLLGSPTPWVWPYEEFMAWYTDQTRGGGP